MKNKDNTRYKIIVVGGGFAGVSAIIEMIRKGRENFEVTLISDKDWFDYKPRIFRVIGDFRPFVVRIPLRTIFEKKPVNIIIDKVEGFELSTQTINTVSGKSYSYDFLVIAMGSDVDYRGIQVIKTMTYTSNNTREALDLKKHVDDVVLKMKSADKAEKLALGHFVIVGGGATGVEMAGSISLHARDAAKRIGIDPSHIMVDLIESGDRILKKMPEDFSDHVKRKLKELDVNILYHRRVTEEHLEEVYLKDTHIKTWTIVWSAGIRASKMLAGIKGVQVDSDGRLLVDETLRLKGYSNVFAVGDVIPDSYYGMAQTAIEHGRYAARTLLKLISGETLSPYEVKVVSYAVPVGPHWAAIMTGSLKLYGRIGSLIKDAIDIRFLNSILPLDKTLKIAISGGENKTIEELEKALETQN